MANSTQAASRPSENVSPEVLQQMIDDGWDIAAWDEIFMNPKPQEEDASEPSIPESVFTLGYGVEAIRPMIGYVVQVCLHQTGWEPEWIWLRPRHAQHLATAIEARAKNRVRNSEVIETAVNDERIAVSGGRRSGIAIFNDFIEVTFGMPVALRLASELRAAAVAHLPSRDLLAA